MSQLHEHHKVMTNGTGKCSRPMWAGGCPAGFCDRPAFGEQEANQLSSGDFVHGKWFPSYVPALACFGHGGPEK